VKIILFQTHTDKKYQKRQNVDHFWTSKNKNLGFLFQIQVSSFQTGLSRPVEVYIDIQYPPQVLDHPDPKVVF
jgi:hypothetical protein